MTKLSLVIPYRNRDTQIAKRCIDSLQTQSIFETNHSSKIDIEILLVDYGSDLEKSEDLKDFCQKKEHITYIYTETRGRFWCKPEALNLALNQVKGDYFLTIDVDMIYLPNFLEQIHNYVNENILLHYQCYYLPKTFDYSNYTTNLLQIDSNNLESSDKTCALGIFAVKTSVLREIGGFDEYYRMWGVEDKDIHFRLSQKLNVEWFPIEKSPVFHQWHPTSNDPLVQPKGWEKLILDHFDNKQDKPELIFHKKANGAKIGNIYTSNERPALKIYEDNRSSKQELESNFSFEFPIEKSYSSFVNKFMKLDTNEALILNQSFSFIDEKATSKASQGVKRLNHFLEKINVSYRMTELLKYMYGNIDFYQVRDFLFYFIVDFGDFIEDYYYTQENNSIGNPKKITLILFKR